MLAQVALIMFALLGLLSLVIDIGLVRLTQAQMQTAADAAALEGLRYRDVGVTDAVTGDGVIDPFAADCIRRAAAHRVVRAVFDDDLDPTGEDPDYAFGAGPIIDLTEGATSLHAQRTLSVPATHVYEPNLQLNQQNAVDGDMVSGQFCYNADPSPSEGAGYALPGMVVCTQTQRGFGSYARNDFNPSTSAPQPPGELPECPAPDDPPPASWPTPGTGSLMTADDSAFLVRLRRSNELQDLAGQLEPGVASSGPALPLLFGHGAPIHGDDPESPYSVRRDGFTVRATAIAAVRPAMHVGLPQAIPFTRGVSSYVVRDTFAVTLGPDPTTLVTVNLATGVICSAPPCAGLNPPTLIGRFVADRTTINTVGRALLPVAASLPSCAAVAGSGFTPVYSLMASGTNRIIGFARINIGNATAMPPNLCAAPMTRGALQLVADANATASLSEGLALPPGIDPRELRELLDKHFERTGVAYLPLLAPALVR